MPASPRLCTLVMSLRGGEAGRLAGPQEGGDFSAPALSVLIFTTKGLPHPCGAHALARPQGK